MTNISLPVLSASAGDLEDLKALPNSTSSSITISWTTGSDGNHPPLNTTVDVSLATENCYDNTGYESHSHVIFTERSQVYYVIEGLDSNTVYDVRLQGHNQRGHDSSSSFAHVCNVSTSGMSYYSLPIW